jgi:hypothetical protein
MVPGDEDEMVVPGGRPTEYVGPLETGLNDARARPVGAEGGLSVRGRLGEKGDTYHKQELQERPS